MGFTTCLELVTKNLLDLSGLDPKF